MRKICLLLSLSMTSGALASEKVDVRIEEDRISCGSNYLVLVAPEVFPDETFGPYAWVGAPMVDDCEIKHHLLEEAASSGGVLSAIWTHETVQMPEYCSRNGPPCRYVDGFRIGLKFDGIRTFWSQAIKVK